MPKPVNLRIRIAPTRRTDLCCIVCNRFRTEYAIIPVGGDASRESVDAQFGIHRACRSGVHHKKGARPDASISVSPRSRACDANSPPLFDGRVLHCKCDKGHAGAQHGIPATDTWWEGSPPKWAIRVEEKVASA